MTQHRNPFRYLKPVPPEKFVGRWSLVERIGLDLTLAGGDSHACIGGRRFGKSSLLAALHHHLCQPELAQGGYSVLPIVLDFKRYNFGSESAFFGRVLKEICRRVDITSRRCPQDSASTKVALDRDWLDSLLADDPPGLSLDQFEDAVFHIFEQLDEVGGPARLVLLLDEVDDSLRYPWHRVLYNQLRSCIYYGDLADYVRLVLVGSRRFLDEVSDRGSPLWNILRLHYLSNLDEDAIFQLCNRDADLPKVAKDAIWQQSGGHPFLAQYLLHHLWETGASASADESMVAHMADRFLYERQADLEGWAKAVEIAGLQLYHQFVHQPGWMDEEDLIQAVADRDIPAKRGLVALSYHGFITHDGAWKRYRRASSLLRSWYIQEGPRLIKKMLTESENQEESSQPVQRHQTFHTGDIYHLTGNFQKAILNIKSTLSNVTQTIGALPDADPSTKAELEKLIKELNNALHKVPDDKAEEAVAVAQSTEVLIEKVAEEKSNKTMVQITGEGLKKAAENLADVMPTVLTIATQIVAVVSKFVAQR